jgi:hypothetical protein
MGSFGNGLDVNNTKGRVGRGFDPNKLGVGSEFLFNIGRIAQVDKGGIDTNVGSNLGKVTISTTIDIVDRDHMATLLKAVDNGGSGGRTGSKSKTVLGTFQSSNSFFKVVSVGITGTRVFETL